ncbi:carbonic anhydrase family protein [Lacticaseibacillus hulanensis]|uniref:carbonic anhydrase family protein n=1 Tax=Lacticaseibacillus hulanensis TaxID=2493111 RepID=UPI000FD78478|nr:carbonic anhydrase family protein [Lacticaseibacillus hulanensis]
MEFDYAHQNDWPQVVGQAQSPVDLEMANAQPERWTGLHPALRGTAARATRYNLQVTGGGLTEIGGRTASFDHLHFHCGGEHATNGKRGVMEAHFVHHFSDGQVVVVAVPLIIGAPSPVLGAILVMPEEPIDTPIALNGLIPNGADWYHYLGSLTTPPVIEGVAWYVSARPQTISVEQLASYQARFPEDNHRELQPLNDRPVLLLHQ